MTNSQIDISKYEEGFAEIVKHLDFLPDTPEVREKVLKSTISMLLTNPCL